MKQKSKTYLRERIENEIWKCALNDVDAQEISKTADKILETITTEIFKGMPEEIGWDEKNKDKKVKDLSRMCAYGYNLYRQKITDYIKSLKK